MKFFAKYGIGIYLIITLFFKIKFVIPVEFTNFLYFIVMGFGIVLFFYYQKQIVGGNNLKAFSLLFQVLFLNTIYFIFFDLKSESLLYFLAKLSTTALVILGVNFNYNFYKYFFQKYFKYIFLIIIIFGFLFGYNDSEDYTGTRMALGYNPNDLGLFGVFGFFSTVLFNRKWYKSGVNVLLIIIFLSITLMSGSKAALLNLVLGIVLIYRFSFKLFASSIILIFAIFITTKFGYITSIDRLLSNEQVLESRDEVFDIGLLTINDSLLLGHGLDKYGWTDPKYWKSPEMALGPHNTYLSIGIMYGVIFGSIFILFLLIFLFKTLNKFLKSKEPYIQFCYLILIVTVVNGFFETLIVAVNEFISLLFWFCLGVIGFTFNYQKINKLKV